MRRGLALGALAFAVASGGQPRIGRAQPAPPPEEVACATTLSDFEIVAGALSEGARCGQFVAIASPMVSTFSYGMYRYREAVTVPYRVHVKLQRLSADSHRAVELHVFGGILLVKDGQYALYATEAGFARSGWRDLPALRLHQPTELEVVQSARHVELSIDGRVVDRWELADVNGSGRVAIAFKGVPGYRARMWFDELRIEPMSRGARAGVERRTVR
jgi:hypothetical protein